MQRGMKLARAAKRAKRLHAGDPQPGVIMTRARMMVSLGLLASLAACANETTSPATADLQPSFRLASNPPPPPIDTGTAPTGSVQTSFAVTYFFNPVGSSGFLMFDKTQDGSTEVDKNAQVRLHNGTFSGKGSLSADVNGDLEGGLLLVDLASVNSELSRFAGCEQAAGEVVPTAAPDDREDTGCFSLTFDGATLDGVPVPFVLEPSCRPGDPRRVCVRTEDIPTQ